ncbi:phage tail protein, partial [Cellvibrio mixtus]|uniref:phage tail protein n=1 Tax=Cellvibrio mixtus TaxID=39650 RepID=UPI00190F9938
MVETLLPPASTSLERALSQALSFPALDAHADAPARIRTELPAAFAPFIAAEFFLSGFTNYFDSAEELIHAGLPWLRQRGTAAAVKRALRWIQIDALLDDDSNWLHIDPGTPRAPAKLADIRNIVNLSIPAHVYFYRLFHRYDIRHAVGDQSHHDNCIWDDDSGAWIDGIKISIEERIAIPAKKTESPCKQSITSVLAITVRREQAYWDSWVLD